MVEKKGTRKRRSSEEVAAEKRQAEEAKSKNLIDAIYGDLLDLTEDEAHFFPSGSLIIDSVLSNGKGIPLGKFISITAAEGVGKSSMCLHIARNCCAKGYRCLYIDTECGINRSQLESFSMMPFVENRTFLPKTIRTYRELDDLFSSILKEKGDKELKFIFLDSLTDVVPDQVLNSNISELNQPGLDARAQSLLFRKYKFPFSDAGITVFFILQQRTKIAMSYWEKSVDQGAGGHAVKHAMDIALDLTKKNFISRSVKGHDEPTPYGSECYLKAIKNRYAPPMIPMLIQIIFGKGVSNSGAIANALILNGIARTNSRKYFIEYQGESLEFVGKPKFEDFVKSHLDYFKDIIESCGGIKLVPDSEVAPPNDVLSSDTQEEESVNEEELTNEELICEELDDIE